MYFTVKCILYIFIIAFLFMFTSAEEQITEDPKIFPFSFPVFEDDLLVGTLHICKIRQ